MVMSLGKKLFHHKLRQTDTREKYPGTQILTSNSPTQHTHLSNFCFSVFMVCLARIVNCGRIVDLEMLACF